MVNNQRQSELSVAMAETIGDCTPNERYLLLKYSSTMGLCDVAAELGTSANALRIRQNRFGDLPDPIPGLRGYRWPTVTIAEWISNLTRTSGSRSGGNKDGPRATATKRRGRPRKQRHPIGTGRQEGVR